MGDNFLATTFRDYVVNNENADLYFKNTFEVTGYCLSRFSDKNQNMISRIVNSFAYGINKGGKLPRYMVLVFDDDLIDFLAYEGYGVASMYGLWIEKLIKTLNDMCQDIWSSMPSKSRRNDYPMIYWVSPPHHANFKNNQARTKFNACLDVALKVEPNMRTIKMKEIWDYENQDLVNNGTDRLTMQGYGAYWASIDAALRYNIIRHELFTCKQKKEALQKSIEADNNSRTSANDQHRVKTSKIHSAHDDHMQQFFDKR